MQSELTLVAVRIIIRRRTPVIGSVSASPRKRQDSPVDSRRPVIGRVSAGPIAMQKTLLQYLIETFLQYNDVANRRKTHFHQF